MLHWRRPRPAEEPSPSRLWEHHPPTTLQAVLDTLRPFPDRSGYGFEALTLPNDSVGYSPLVRSFVRAAREARLRPVIVSKEREARLSWFTLDALRAANGSWAYRWEDEQRRQEPREFDAISGFRIRRLDDIWRDLSGDRERIPDFHREDPSAIGALLFDVFVRRWAEDDTVVGPLARLLVSQLGGGPLRRWGLDEPLCEPWDPAALTASLQSRMPQPPPHLLEDGNGAVAAVTISPTREGLIERVAGAVPLGGYLPPERLLPDRPPALHPAVTRALEAVASEYAAIGGMVSYGELSPLADGTPGRRIGARRPDTPLAMLVGPRSLQELSLDVEAIRSRHDVVPVHRNGAPVPSLIARLSGPDPVWHQLLAFVHDAGAERLGPQMFADVHRGGLR